MARAQTTTSTMRCLVLGPQGEAMPADLEGAMARQGLRIEVCIDAYHAMAQMVAHEGGIGAAQGLIIVEPARVRHGMALMETASIYAPQVVLWRYAMEATPRLARLTEAALEQNTQVAAPSVPASLSNTGEGRGLRLVGREDAPLRSTPTGDILDGDLPVLNEDRPGSVLTQEELALLLATDESDAAGLAGEGT